MRASAERPSARLDSRGLIAILKSRVPWWSKIATKLVLSRLPVGYARWRRLQLFVHGGMLDERYVTEVFADHITPVRDRLPDGFTMAELGPGDSVSSALLAKAWGARRSWLVDVGPFATREVEHYRAVYERYADRLGPLPDTFDAMLADAHATYLTAGLAGLRDVPSASVDFLFSEAVLEHVRLHEFDETVRQTFRVLRPGGVASHTIDLQDHLAGSLHSLRFRPEVWESSWFASSGFYTNRRRAGAIRASCAAAGFEELACDVARWPAIPLSRSVLHEEFRDLSDEELRVRRLRLVLLRPS
jgi:SAM-dependent methyltransferase